MRALQHNLGFFKRVDLKTNRLCKPFSSKLREEKGLFGIDIQADMRSSTVQSLTSFRIAVVYCRFTCTETSSWLEPTMKFDGLLSGLRPSLCTGSASGSARATSGVAMSSLLWHSTKLSLMQSEAVAVRG